MIRGGFLSAQARNAAGTALASTVAVFVVMALGLGATALGMKVHGRSAAAPAAWVAGQVPLRVMATGQDDQWQFTFTGPDGDFDTADDLRATQNLHLPTDTLVRLQLRSADQVYVFGVPQLGLQQIAVPDLDFELNWRTGAADSFALQGDAMCRTTHPALRRQLTVESSARFATWLAQLGRQSP